MGLTNRVPANKDLSWLIDVTNVKGKDGSVDITQQSYLGGGRYAVLVGSDNAISLWPVGDGTSRVVRGSEPGDRPVAWSADGRSLWLFRRGEVPTNVFRLDLTNGRRELWKTLVPPDPAGVYSIIEFRVTPSGDSYFYSYRRLLSQLFLATGFQ